MKILLADDHALFRAGIHHILEQLDKDATIFEAGNYDELLALLDSHDDAGLALVDLHMPGTSGPSFLPGLILRAPALPWVVLSGSEKLDDMRTALDAGVMGYIPKWATAPVMLSALQLVLAGGIYVPPELMNRTTLKESGSNAGAVNPLTPRQIEVLQAAIAGQSNKEIARVLGMSDSTVKAHLASIYRSLGVGNRMQATQVAERLGLLPAKQRV